MTTKIGRRKVGDLPEGKKLKVSYDYVEVWLDHCVGKNCLQCIVEGKIPCSPRFWLEGKPK